MKAGEKVFLFPRRAGRESKFYNSLSSLKTYATARAAPHLLLRPREAPPEVPTPVGEGPESPGRQQLMELHQPIPRL